jgi:Ser/Thr protein kinase RdoA (MazF antagonist)
MQDSLASAVSLAKSALLQWPNIAGEPTLVMHRENTVFRVETTTGPAALRLHRQGYHSFDAIQSELDWMAYLANHGVQVPAPLPTKNGKLLLECLEASGEKRFVDLLAWIDGEPLGASHMPFARPVAQTCALFHNLGIALAKLHTLSDQWRKPESFTRHAWDRDGLIGDNPFWGRFWSLSDMTEDVACKLALARDFLRQDLDRAIERGLDYGLIHADLVRENVLVAGTKVCMIDFDDAGFGFRMFDIATALYKNRNEPNYSHIEAALLSGYASHHRLSKQDIATLPLFTVLRSLTYLGWAQSRLEEAGMRERQQRFISEALALFEAYRTTR